MKRFRRSNLVGLCIGVLWPTGVAPAPVDAHPCVGITPDADQLNCQGDLTLPDHMCTTHNLVLGRTLIVCVPEPTLGR